MIWYMFPVLDLYYADPAQPLTWAGEELDYLDHDLSGLCPTCEIVAPSLGSSLGLETNPSLSP